MGAVTTDPTGQLEALFGEEGTGYNSGNLVQIQPFNVFDHIDQVVRQEESRDVYTVREPRVWPSAASVELYDQTKNKIAGKCMRAVFLNMIGMPPSRPMTVEGMWIMIMGRMIEEKLTQYARTPVKGGEDIHVSSGVRVLVEDMLLSFELDLVALDPWDNHAVLVEQKTFSTKNYQKATEILKDGKPAIDNLLQICTYLMEIQTGEALRGMIRNGLKDRVEKDAKLAEDMRRHLENPDLFPAPAPHRNRIDVSQDNLRKMTDAPVTAKLTYFDRAAGLRREFDIAIEKDPIDDLTYPVVDGQVWKLFPLESIYARYKQLQKRFYAARMEAERILLERGIEPPAEPVAELLPTWAEKNEFYAKQKAYYDMVGDQMRRLPPSFWPPAEYELDYSPEKIEKLWTLGLVAKTRYEGWKRKHKGKERIGDAQCSWCDHGLTCQKVERPDLANLIYDIQDAQGESSE